MWWPLLMTNILWFLCKIAVSVQNKPSSVRHPGLKWTSFDSSFQFEADFQDLLDNMVTEKKASSACNPQSNSVLWRAYQALGGCVLCAGCQHFAQKSKSIHCWCRALCSVTQQMQSKFHLPNWPTAKCAHSVRWAVQFATMWRESILWPVNWELWNSQEKA